MSYNVNLFRAFKKISNNYLSLKDKLIYINPEKNYSEFIEINKKISELDESIECFNKYESLIKNLDECLLSAKKENNKDFLALINAEIQSIKTEIPILEKKLQIFLIPKDPNDKKNVIIEIRSAAGGDESSIFVDDIFDSYKKYACQQNWKLSLIDLQQNHIGSTYISFILQGDNVYSKMKFESGVHRVQRIPATESKGRIHTSTITVNVLVERDEIDIKILPEELRIDVFRAGGAGGQHVNKTESAVRITHLPTNIVVACQEGKSQIQNREKALKILKSKLWDHLSKIENEKQVQKTRSQIGTGDFSEKIRTYNYPQNRITDHRISLSINSLDKIMLGDFSEFHKALTSNEESKKIESFTNNLNENNV